MTEDDGRRPTRARILGAAVELLGEVSFSSVTTRALAQRAGVNNALIHYHFGSKVSLLVEAALVRLDDAMAEPLHLLVAAPSPGAGAAAVLRWMARLDPDDRSIRLMTDLTIEAFRNPDVRPAMAAVLERSRVDMAAGLDDAGRDAPPRDPAHRGTADVLVALFDGLMLHRLIDPGFDLEPAAAALEDWLGSPGAGPAGEAGR